MDSNKPVRQKSKTKKVPSKGSKTKKRKSETKDGPTCSMFLSEIRRKLAQKKREEENAPVNVVQAIIDSITNALPIKFFKRPPSNTEQPVVMETLQTYAPELLPNDTIEIPRPEPLKVKEPDDDLKIEVDEIPSTVETFKMPRMPIVESEELKIPEKRRKITMETIAVNTGEHDMAKEIAKHVGTLKKISLIAEEFNQKTAKNLKEIVDSVQEDLIKKLEEIQSVPESPVKEPELQAAQ